MAIRGDDAQQGPWTGGVWYSRPEEDIAPDEIASMENMRLQAAAACEKRLGTASYQSAAAIVGNPTVTMLAEFTVPPTTTHVVAVMGAVIYEYSSGWSDITGAVTVTAGDDNTFEWAVDEATGTILATNGVDAPWKWTGTGNAAAADVDSRFTTAEHVAFWDNKVWWGNTDTDYDRVWRSDTGDIDTIGANSFHQYGHPVTAMVPTRNNLTVHTTGGIFVVTRTGNDTVPYQIEQVTGRENQGGVRMGRAALDGRAVVVLPGDRQMFLRNDGVYLWDGGDSVEKKSFQLDLGYWPDLVTARLTQAFALYYPTESEAWFWLPHGTGQTEMNHIMIYSDRFDCWFGPYTGTDAYFYRNCAALIGNKPHAGTLNSSGSIGGTVQDHAPVNTYNDDDGSAGGAAIRSYFRTGATAPEGSGTRLRWLYTKTYYDATGNFDVTVTQESSGVSGTSETLNMSGGGFVLDQGKLDEDELGTVRMLSQDSDLSEYDPHSSLKFTNNAVDEFFRIRRTHPTYKVVGRKRSAGAGVT